MNLTVLAALLLLVAWVVLAFVVAIPAGWVHLGYAGAMILAARRIIAGAPRFRS